MSELDKITQKIVITESKLETAKDPGEINFLRSLLLEEKNILSGEKKILLEEKKIL